MKTKIIYISGNEVFDMADIRAAFEEVRHTLGLGKDTVMFGVPVDNDDALGAVEQESVNSEPALNEPATDKVEVVTENADVVDEEYIEPNVIEPEPVVEVVANTIETAETADTPAPQNIKKPATRKPRARSKEKVSEKSEEIEANQSESNEKIIPILSILAAKKDEPAQESEPEQVIEPEIVTEDASESVSEAAENSDDAIEASSDIDISAEFESDDAAQEHNSTIADMITDEAPEAPVEKTLEQLLESMTPLREDITEETTESIVSDEDMTEDEAESAITDSDTDATLEQLAAEFAENQDKIPAQPKSESHSKIGKLKNILPFKKAKRDDSGLMGDLFGWAGIAANDDDFAIPGFFTNAASKK